MVDSHPTWRTAVEQSACDVMRDHSVEECGKTAFSHNKGFDTANVILNINSAREHCETEQTVSDVYALLALLQQ